MLVKKNNSKTDDSSLQLSTGLKLRHPRGESHIVIPDITGYPPAFSPYVTAQVFYRLNDCDISQKMMDEGCKKCFMEQCRLLNFTCTQYNQSSSSSSVVILLSILLVIVVSAIVSAVCFYLLKWDDCRAARSVRQLADEGESPSKMRPALKLERPTTLATKVVNSDEEVQNTRFKLKTLKIGAQQMKTEKTAAPVVKSQETTATGDMAFIAPRDGDPDRDAPIEPQRDIHRDLPRESQRDSPREPVKKLSPKSPLFVLAGKDQIVSQDVKRDKDKMKDKAKERRKK